MSRDTLRNADGQAPTPRLHFGRICRERPHELTGLLRGIIADGGINSGEVAFVKRWFEANWDYMSEWPYNVLYERFAAAIADGVLTQDEERELLGLIASHIGGGLTGTGNSSSQLLCDDPAPEIVFADKVFVITGLFLSGKRRAVEMVVEHLGGMVRDSVTGKTNYLLIGSSGSRDWLMSNYGTKIMGAADRKQAGQAIGVVSERDFLRQLEPRADELGPLLHENLRPV